MTEREKNGTVSGRLIENRVTVSGSLERSGGAENSRGGRTWGGVRSEPELRLRRRLQQQKGKSMLLAGGRDSRIEHSLRMMRDPLRRRPRLMIALERRTRRVPIFSRRTRQLTTHCWTSSKSTYYTWKNLTYCGPQCIISSSDDRCRDSLAVAENPAC